MIPRQAEKALRAGLRALDEEPADRKPYRTDARPMGLREGHTLDNVHELVARVEGGDAR